MLLDHGLGQWTSQLWTLPNGQAECGPILWPPFVDFETHDSHGLIRDALQIILTKKIHGPCSVGKLTVDLFLGLIL